MARPRKTPATKRTERLGLRLTPDERMQLELSASALGLTAAEFMRRCTLGYPIAARQEDRMAEARLASALIRLGVNLNQIARHMNAGRSAPAYLEELILRIDRHLDELYGPRRP